MLEVNSMSKTVKKLFFLAYTGKNKTKMNYNNADKHKSKHVVGQQNLNTIFIFPVSQKFNQENQSWI